MRKLFVAGAALMAFLLAFGSAGLTGASTAVAVTPTAVLAPASTTTTMSLSRSSSVQYRGSTTRAKVTATVKRGTKAATGTVTFYRNGKKVATRTLTRGKTVYTLPSTAALGKHTIKAVHNRTKVARSTSVTVKLREKVSLRTSATSWTIGKTAPLITATVAGKKTTGKIKFYVDGKYRVTKSVSKGKASYRLPTKLAAGKHTVRANYVATNIKYAPPAKAPTIAVTAKRPASTSTAKYMTSDGTYKVGTSIKPGLYRTSGSTSYCYWERRNRSGSSFEGIIDNDSGSGQRYMQILSSDKYVKVSFCGSWIKAPTSKPLRTTMAADGVYRVGYDIRPGTYKTRTSTSGCYWSRLSGARGSFDQIIENDFGSGHHYVTIRSTDKFFSTQSCGTGWTRVK